MSEETNHQMPADPMEAWEQWYGAVSKGWSRAVNGNGNKTAPPDPLSLYQTWLKSVSTVQEQFLRGAGDPQELWKQWFEVTTDFWRKAAEAGGDPTGLMKQWMEMMEETRNRLFAGMPLPADPFTFFKQWYDATNETWSSLVGEVIGTEKFMDVSSEFLKTYASFYATMRRASEEYFRNLQLPTRSDIARVAELIVNLEEKVDQIDSELEDFEDGAGSSLSQLPVALQKLAAVEQLEQRTGSLEQRLERVEGKLDTLLASLDKLAAREEAKPAAPARRTKRKPGTPSQKSAGAPSKAES